MTDWTSFWQGVAVGMNAAVFIVFLVMSRD